MWSSITKEEYLGVSATYITKDWKRITRLIDVKNMDDFHLNGSNIKS